MLMVVIKRNCHLSCWNKIFTQQLIYVVCFQIILRALELWIKCTFEIWMSLPIMSSPVSQWLKKQFKIRLELLMSVITHSFYCLWSMREGRAIKCRTRAAAGVSFCPMSKRGLRETVKMEGVAVRRSTEAGHYFKGKYNRGHWIISRPLHIHVKLYNPVN